MIASSLIFLGCLLLCLSLKRSIEICRLSETKGWKVLTVLIVLFIFSYFAVGTLLTDRADTSLVDWGFSGVLLLGSFFVFIVTKLSHQSLMSLNESKAVAELSANHDYLTKLENRKRCLQVIDEWQAKDKLFSVVMIDLNNFKQINDAKGHCFGDDVLIEVAACLSRSLLKGGGLYRIGGDEFVILLPAIDEACILSQNQSVKASFDKGIKVNDLSLDIKYSAGATFRTRTNHLSAMELIKQADIAMYAAKHAKKTLTIFDETLHQGMKSEFQLLNKLKTALSRGELEVYYQPILELDSHHVHGVEALIRWQRNDGEMIMPDQFIAVAERNQLIQQLSIFVVNRVFKDLPMLLQTHPDLVVHINLSSQDMNDTNLVNIIESLYHSKAVDPKHVIFELTESSVLGDIDNARVLMNKLITIGFAVSLDDFGTGFSSFSLLKELPISQIKIDRSFIATLLESKKDKAIVESMIYLADRLSCSVVAEGVESELIMDWLIDKGCPFAQGYKIGEPMTISDCTHWLRSSNLVHHTLNKIDKDA